MSTNKSLSKVLDKKLGAITFGGFLRSARTLKDMSQIEMAKFLGISKSSLCDIEKNRQFVSLHLASKIAKKCGLSETLAIEIALQQLVNRSGLKLEVAVKKAA